MNEGCSRSGKMGAASDAGGASEATLSVSRTPLWRRCVSAGLAALLAVTMMDARGVQYALAANQGQSEETAPMAETDADASSGDEASQPSAEAGSASAANDEEAASSAADPSSEPDQSGASNVEAPSEGPADAGASAAASDEGDASKGQATNPSATPATSEEESLPAPDNLVPTDQVEPARNDGRGNVASLLDPRVDVSGAPRADAGFYQVGSSAAHVDVELGQLRSALGDGHLGAAYDGDRVVVTVDAPYLYFTDDSTLKETLSPEEWLQNGGQEAGMRAAVVADEVPEGWSVWTRWSVEEGYQRVGDDDVRSGVSGRIVLRYDGVEGTDTAGGRLRADSVMPSFDLRFAGDVPAGRDVSVPVGYMAGSFTASDGSVLTGMAEGFAGTVVLRNDEPAAKADFQAERIAAPAEGEEAGWLAYRVTYHVPEGYPAASEIGLSWSDGYDRSAPAADGDAALPVLLDVTGLSDQDVAAIDPSDTAAAVAAGASVLGAGADGRWALSAEDERAVAPGETVVLYAAVPYETSENANGGGGGYFRLPVRRSCARMLAITLAA